MDKEEFSQIDPNVRILVEESSKMGQHMQQVVDLSGSCCRVGSWTMPVEPRVYRSKYSNVNRLSLPRDKESNRSAGSGRSHSPLSCKIQDQPGPESEFLHFEDCSDYMHFYREEKLKRQEFALREALEKGKRHNRKNNKNDKTSFRSNCIGCDRLRDKNVPPVQSNSKKPLTSSAGYIDADREDVPLMIVISSNRSGPYASNLPQSGHFLGRRLQQRPSDQPARKPRSVAKGCSYRKQNR